MFKNLLLIFLTLSFLITIYADNLREIKIDNNHSTIGFWVPIMGGLSKVSGKFTDFSIVLNDDSRDITKCSVKVVIKTSSIDTGIPARDAHLKTADFFDTEKFPEITFESTRIRKQGKSFVATGNLTMRGVTKEIELPFDITGKVATKNLTNIGYAAKLKLNRRDYSVNWEHPTSPNFVGDEVEVDIRLISKAIKD